MEDKRISKCDWFPTKDTHPPRHPYFSTTKIIFTVTPHMVDWKIYTCNYEQIGAMVYHTIEKRDDFGRGLGL